MDSVNPGFCQILRKPRPREVPTVSIPKTALSTQRRAGRTLTAFSVASILEMKLQISVRSGLATCAFLGLSLRYFKSIMQLTIRNEYASGENVERGSNKSGEFSREK